MEKDKEILLL